MLTFYFFPGPALWVDFTVPWLSTTLNAEFKKHAGFGTEQFSILCCSYLHNFCLEHGPSQNEDEVDECLEHHISALGTVLENG